MKFEDMFICPSCGAQYRPTLAEEICTKCAADEARRLAEIAHENEGKPE